MDGELERQARFDAEYAEKQPRICLCPFLVRVIKTTRNNEWMGRSIACFKVQEYVVSRLY